MKKMGITFIILGIVLLVIGIYYVARSANDLPTNKDDNNIVTRLEDRTETDSNKETSSTQQPISHFHKMGADFEEYVVNLLNPKDFRLIEKVNDYAGNFHYAERNKYPDIVFRDIASNQEFAIECKYRSEWKDYNGQKDVMWAEQDKIDDYNKFSRDRNIPVVVMFGIGGTPKHPAELYCIPLKQMQRPNYVTKNWLSRHRINPDKHIYWAANQHNLTNNTHR